MKVPTPYQLPSGKWFVRLRLNGQTYQSTFDSEKEATAWATSIKAQYNAKQLKERIPDEDKTIRQLMKEYVKSATLSQSGRDNYDVTMRLHFQPIMDKPYNTIRSWQKMVNMELQKYNPNTVQLRWGEIAASLRFHGLDVPQVKIPKKQKKRKNYLTEEQIKVFCDAIKGHRHEVYFLMMLSSMRVSEALSVEPKDITEKGIHVRGTKTEASDRFVPWMIPRLKEICHELPPTDRRILNLELKQICKENNLPEISNHSLRISFCSLCYLKGIPEKICMKIGGWKTLSVMHEVYVRISEDDVDRYASILEDVFR